jgi:hypothetical protein
VNNDITGRTPSSHAVLNDGLVINDYTLSRPEITTLLNSYDNDLNHSRSISPVLGRSISSIRGRTRSPKLSQSMDFERRERSQSPQRYLSNSYDDGKIII